MGATAIYYSWFDSTNDATTEITITVTVGDTAADCTGMLQSPSPTDLVTLVNDGGGIAIREATNIYVVPLWQKTHQIIFNIW
mmetsp:Transcript_36385/g.44446  ORF Transcript_36385/g.44446 Transcript_36385/m.44446 type:complete len:82 (-) Transcript_36385:1226-1471(-)